MSNYLFVFATERVKPRLSDWVRRYQSVAGEVYETQVSPSVNLTIISHDLNASVDVPTGTFFKGNVVDHRAGSVIFGLKGWLEYSAKHDTADYDREGQFLRVDWNGRSVKFSRDAFGMLPLLHTQGSGYVAVSDSMMALADLRRHMGDAVTPNEEALLARALLAAYGGQQISPDTYAEQISFVPARQSLSVSVVASPYVKVTGAALDGLRLGDGETYQDCIREGAENVARLMATLAQLGEWKPNLSLSGGYDSRVPLAGAVASGVAQDLHINTKNNLPIHAPDYAVASLIAERYGLHLNEESPAGYLNERKYDATPFQMWALADLGMYDYVTRTKAARNPRKHIGLGGMGGEVMRGNYQWQTWPDIIAGLKDPNPVVAEALYTQGLKGLEAVGVDPGTKQSSELHYMNYRYALHGGTNRPLHMMSFAPLLQSKMVALAYSDKNEFPYTTHYEVGLINDLAIVLSPDLAVMPYDDPGDGRVSKDLSQAYVDERLAHLGGPVDTSILKPYEVFGTPDDVPAGPPEFMLSLARRRGFDRPQNAETMLDLGAKGIETLTSEPLRSIYAKVYANGKWRLVTKKYSISAAKDSPGKPVALHALFGS